MNPIHLEDGQLLSTWRDAELLACGHMRSIGFNDAQTTGAGADGGLDVMATGAGAQVKHFTSGPVGSPAVQRLLGAAAGHRHSLFYTLAGYTSAATKLAEAQNVALFTYNLEGEVAACSTQARLFLEYGFALWNPEVDTSDRTEFIDHLRAYAQRVSDACSTVLEEIMPPLRSMTSDLVARDRRPEADEILEQVEREANRIVLILESINGRREHVYVDLLRRVEELESLGLQLARRVGIDYERVSRRMRNLRDGTE